MWFKRVTILFVFGNPLRHFEQNMEKTAAAAVDGTTVSGVSWRSAAVVAAVGIGGLAAVVDAAACRRRSDADAAELALLTAALRARHRKVWLMVSGAPKLAGSASSPPPSPSGHVLRPLALAVGGIARLCCCGGDCVAGGGAPPAMFGPMHLVVSSHGYPADAFVHEHAAWPRWGAQRFAPPRCCCVVHTARD